MIDDKNINDNGQNFINELGVQFKNKDESVFEKIYTNTYGWVRSYVYKRIPSLEVDDCLQLVYLKLYQNIDKFDPNCGTFRTWFNALVKNETIDYIRRTKKYQESETSIYNDEGEIYIDIEDTTMQPEKCVEQKERQRVLVDLLSELSEAQRSCIMLHYIDGMKNSEIANLYGISEGTVKSRISYGLKKVENKYKEMQKRGAVLYNIAPLSLFVWLLRNQFMPVLEYGTSEILLAEIKRQITNIGIGALASATVAEATSTATISGTVSTVGTVTTTSTVIGTGATVAVTSKGIIVKVISIVTAIIFVAGGTFVAHKYMRKEKQSTTQNYKTDEAQSTEIAAIREGSDTVIYDDIIKGYESVLTGKKKIKSVSYFVNEEGYYATGILDFQGVTYVDREGYFKSAEYDVVDGYYTYYDINSDGIPELLTTLEFNGEQPSNNLSEIASYCDIYTAIREKPVKLTYGGYRYYIYICSDGIIGSRANGGAETDTYTFSKMSSSGNLENVDVLEKNHRIVTRNGEFITQEEYDEIIENYEIVTDTVQWYKIGK